MNDAKVLAVTLMSTLFLMTEPLSANEKIVGAFGLRLGDTFDLATSIGQASLKDGTPLYQFSPSNPFRSFKDYYVLITPKSHKIYGIWAEGPIDNDPMCKKEQELLISMLQDKYGKKKKEDLASVLFDATLIEQGNRYVMTKCTGFMEVTIGIRYKDTTLEKVAETERITLESKRLDSSGL